MSQAKTFSLPVLILVSVATFWGGVFFTETWGDKEPDIQEQWQQIQPLVVLQDIADVNTVDYSGIHYANDIANEVCADWSEETQAVDKQIWRQINNSCDELGEQLVMIYQIRRELNFLHTAHPELFENYLPQDIEGQPTGYGTYTPDEEE